MTDAPHEVAVDVLMDGFTAVEAAGWLILDTAIRRYVERGATMAAIPHHLVQVVLRTPAYPTELLAPVIDPEGAYCGLGGFHRDERAGVDYWCLLPYEHEGRHGWELTAAAVADAVAQGYRPELDDPLDLLDELDEPNPELWLT